MKVMVSLALALVLVPFAHSWALADESGAARPQLVIETNMGDVTLELEAERAPTTVENFLKYVRSGFYAGTIFHRVIESFMIQGGGYTKENAEKTPLYPPIKLESRNGLKNIRGTVAMARTRLPDTATCQFFINLTDNPALDYNETTNPVGYAVFGRVVGGMDVVDKISKVRVQENNVDGTADQTLPVSPVLIKSVRLLSSAEKGR